MIIPNGYIRFNKSTEATTNGDGYFVVAPGAWGEAIECQYLPSINLQARSQGEATTSHAYTIYVEQMVKLPSEVVKLYDRDNNEIGQFSVRSYEQLDAVCQTKIVL
jgi:hypothetical protein